MMMGYFCKRCRETLDDGQAECPFCMNPATPLDECISVVASWHNPDCEWHHEQVASECSCPTIGRRAVAPPLTGDLIAAGVRALHASYTRSDQECVAAVYAAIAMEAAKPTRRETGSARKGDSAGPKDIAQSQPLGNPLDTGDGK